MAQPLFRNAVYESKDYKGLITDNHLFSLYQQEPQLADNIYREISQMYLGNSAVNFVNQFPVMEIEQENGFYQWMIKGQERKNVALRDAETLGGAKVSLATFPAAVGANRQRFILVFDEPFFDVTEVIKGETDDYHFLVKQAYEDGGKYKVEVELYNDDVDIAVPASYLGIGKRFVGLYGRTPSTLSYEGAQPHFNSGFRLQNRASMCRMEYTVPGNMLQKGKNEPLLFPFKFRGKTIPVWTNYIEMAVKAQADEMEAFGALYGKKNWNTDRQYLNFDDKTKFEIGGGMGFFDQIAPGNQHRYNTFDIEHLCTMALDMSIGRIGRGDRHLHILTGERGAIAIHKSIDQKQSTSKWTVVNTSASLEAGLGISGGPASNIGHARSLSFGQQFTEYHWYNGIKVTVEILDFFDDDVMFPARHPSNDGIAESHRMLVMGLGEDAGIKRVKIKGQDDITRVLPGLRDPFSVSGSNATSPNMIVSKVDGYEVVCAKWGGLNIEDPTKILDWQLNIQA